MNSADEFVFADLPRTQQDVIAQGWLHQPTAPGAIFDGLSPEKRWEVFCLTRSGQEDHADELRRIASNVDSETNRVFDELVGNAPDPLPVEDLAAMLARVDAAPAPRYLVRSIIAEGDYGMLGGPFKDGKTNSIVDLAVSVASGTPWLGHFPVDVSGDVLVFAGEGGPRKLTRRIRAICEARDLDPASLPIRICLRVPHLTSEAALALVDSEVASTRPALVIIDPLYLAARGARGSDLYEMGSHLEGIQHVCQRHGSALLIVTHWNKTGEGRGCEADDRGRA